MLERTPLLLELLSHDILQRAWVEALADIAAPIIPALNKTVSGVNARCRGRR